MSGKRKTKDRKKEEERQLEKRERTKYKYIGESSSSVYERVSEHWKDFENLNQRYHILKHYLDKHQDIPVN